MAVKSIKNLIIPSASNGFVPKILTKTGLMVYLLLASLAIIYPIYSFRSYLAQLSQVITFSKTEIIDLANQDRLKNGLPALKENAALSLAAKEKAKDMIKNQYFDHFSPQGLSPWFFFKKSNYNYRAAGENLAIDFTSAQAIEKAFMKSPTHRANILNPIFKEIGVAVVKGVYQNREAIFVVQFFGAPAEFSNIALSPPTQAATAPPAQNPLPTPAAASQQKEKKPAETNKPPAAETASVPEQKTANKLPQLAGGLKIEKANFISLSSAPPFSDEPNNQQVILAAILILVILVSLSLHITRAPQVNAKLVVRTLFLVMIFSYVAVSTAYFKTSPAQITNRAAFIEAVNLNR